jgi:oligopeptidase B
VEFEEELYEANCIYTNKEDKFLRISYSSLTTPTSVLEFEFATKELHTRKTQEVLGYNASLYECKRLWAFGQDGAKIPLSMVYRKDKISSNKPNPLLLYGYGSYGYGMPVSFRSNIVSLLDRGFIYVIAHIRGGDELGYEWYEKAKFLTKKLTFEDFISAAEYLIANKYTDSSKLAIMVGSAGGMLMGVVANMRPELFKAIVALVPFVDVLNTMLDDTLPLTPGEFEEWGNPIASKEYFNYIKSYSPYDNVIAQNYPTMLVTAGLTDPRVGYWEAAKWVAKLRDLKTDNNLLFLKTEMDSGHKGQSGRFKALEEIAMIYSYVISSIC